MKQTLLLCSFALLASLLHAQKIYFVYLQTETGEPFFVRMNDKLYSSEPSGYLILPRLKDSTYKFKLGFPSKDIDLDFSTSINKKDHGYLIKNLGDKGWGLFDLQSLNLQMSSSNAKKETGFNSNMNAGTQVNAFTALLAKATDDPSLRQNVVFAKEIEKKQAVVQTVEKAEDKPVATDAVVKQEKKPDQVAQQGTKPDGNKPDAVNINNQKADSEKTSLPQAQVYKRSDIVKLSDGSSTDGFESVYVDRGSDGTTDTIRVFIPADNNTTAVKEERKIESVTETRQPDTTQLAKPTQDEPKKEESKKWWQISIGKNKNATGAKDQSKADSMAATQHTDSAAQVVKAGTEEPKKEENKKWWQISLGKDKSQTGGSRKCQAVANSDDFLKLRRKMAGRTNDDGMLDEARKYFKTKCFTTEQIKNLSTMFLSNAGKYNFFNDAYSYTTDPENFPSLQSELKDEYYVSRFKEMLHN